MGVLHVLAVLGLVVAAFAAFEDMNEDQIRDEMVQNIARQKRVLCNSVSNTVASAGSMPKMASGFAMAFGRKKRLIPCVGGTGDSCDYSSSPNRFPIGGVSSGISSGFGGFSGGMITKRDGSQFFGKDNRDIIFVVDSSGSIPDSQFEIAKTAIATLNSAFCPHKMGRSEKTKQVAVVLFSSYAQTVISFEESHQGEGWLSDRVLGLKRINGGTYTTTALRHVREMLGTKESRINDPDTSTHVIVITDGQCNSECNNLKSEAEKLRNMGPGVQLFGLGIGNARACELNVITGNGQELAFGLNDFTKFAKFADAVKDEANRHPEKCI